MDKALLEAGYRLYSGQQIDVYFNETQTLDHAG
ncbi:MAG: hypothetical protein K0R86_632 [Enterobacter kobei]|nr:hypothetical protein [Enterobacter kobei]